MDDIDMLIKVIDGRGTIADAFPGVKYVILINASDENIKEGTISTSLRIENITSI